MPSKLQNNSSAGSVTRSDSEENANTVAVKDKPTIRLHLWLETDEGVFFGAGRAFLLQKIEEHGSLRKAAEDLGMSYRAAWGKIRKTEKVLGVKLIAQCRSKKEGHKLTEEGLLLKEKFSLWFREVEREALKKAGEIFPWPVHGFKEKGRGKILQAVIALSASLGSMGALIKSVV
jgi:molybdate transport system regulatory protein